MLKKALKSLKQRKYVKKLDGQMKGYLSIIEIEHDENQYLNLIEDIINDGILVNGRNGNALTVCGSSMHFSLENNILPLLTTKKLC